MMTTTMSANRRTRTIVAQIGATIHRRLMPTRSTFDSTTSLALSVATVGSGAGNRCIASAEYGDET